MWEQSKCGQPPTLPCRVSKYSWMISDGLGDTNAGGHLDGAAQTPSAEPESAGARYCTLFAYRKPDPERRVNDFSHRNGAWESLSSSRGTR